MTLLSTELISVLKHIAAHPQMHGTTPEEAHGMTVAYASVILHELSGRPVPRCARDVDELIQSQMRDVYKSAAIVPCLSDESFKYESSPSRKSSFAAFSRNCERFVAILENRMNDFK